MWAYTRSVGQYLHNGAVRRVHGERENWWMDDVEDGPI